MAKGRRASTRRRSTGKRRKGFVAIPFNAGLALNGLTNDTVIIQDLFGAAFGEDIFIVSIDTTWILEGMVSEEGPISVGFAHGDLTIAEILENLDAELTDPDDIIQKERARRPVRRAGTFPVQVVNSVLNNGVPIRTPIRFSVGNDHDISFWAVNRSGATISAASQRLEVAGTLYGRWQR